MATQSMGSRSGSECTVVAGRIGGTVPRWFNTLAMLVCLVMTGLGSRGLAEENADTASSKSTAAAKPSRPAVINPITAALGRLLGVKSSGDATVEKGTHTQATYIKVKAGTTGHSLQTFCLGMNGNVLAVVGPPRYFAPGSNAAKASRTGTVQAFDSAGELLRSWKVPFAPQAINVGPEGTVYVAGDGRIARFDADGKLLGNQELPHIAAITSDTDELRKQAEQQLEQSKKQYTSILKQYETQRDRLIQREKEQAEQEKKLAERKKTQGDKTPDAAKQPRRRTRSPQFAKAQFDVQIQAFQEQLQKLNDTSVDSMVEQMVRNLKAVNALAISDKDVFVVCRQLKGYGYSIWRMTPDLDEPKEIVTGLSGCCGQMDIQCHNGEVWAAENSKHRLCAFDRDGKRLASWGKSDRNGAGECFGGCCNPMNLRFDHDGNLYTAESEGLVKRFSQEGKFETLVGKASLSGGCKNVAVDVSADGERIYFCDLPGSRIVVLSQSPQTVTSTKK